MDSTKDIVIENNYILREIKYIRDNKKVIPENIEILEDLAVIHEIKDIKSKPNPQQVIVSHPKSEVDIKLEGEKINRKNEEKFDNGNNLSNEEKKIVFENEKINYSIEYIFNKLKNNEITNSCEDLKNILNEFEENDKIEVIEGIKIKIENEEQEKKFNDLLKLLC